MPTEICSPISRKGSKAGSNQPLVPGTNTNPSVSNFHRATADSVPAQPSHGAPSRHSEETKEEPLCRS